MASRDSEAMNLLVQRSFDARRRYYEIIDAGIEPELGPPVDPDALEALEKELGAPLPPSYRLLLSLHDGWKHWEGDVHLLSVSELLEGEYRDWIETWKAEVSPTESRVLEEGFVIAAQLYADSGLIMLIGERDERGECPIINWEKHPIRRYRDVWELLQADAEAWEELVEQEESSGSESGADT